MPANGFNIGKDISLDIIDPVLGPLRFDIRTRFESVPQYNDLESKALDGVPRFDNIPHGHRLTFGFDRASSKMQDYFAAREAAYFNGQVVPQVSVTETTTEIGGAVSVYRYTGVSLKLTGGTWSGSDIATQTIEAMASRKHKVQ